MGTIFYKGKKYSSIGDYKVSQRGDITTDSNFELLLSTTAESDLTEIGELKKGKGLYYNPNSKTLNVLNGSIIVGNPDSEAQDYGGVSITKTDILVHNGWFTEFGQDTSLKYCMSQLNTGKADKATTLAGYGITDAKIVNGTITLGSNSITPLTSHQDISGKVNKSGDTMTGALNNKHSGISISANPSSTQYYISVNEQDVNGNSIGFIGSFQNTDGSIGNRIYTCRKVGNSIIYHGLQLQLDNSGNPYVYVENPDKWRSALGLGSMATASKADAIKNITRSGTTFTATRADGTTFTFTQQDNDTKYTAGAGISISNNVIVNAGIRDVSASSTPGYIKVSKNGTDASINIYRVPKIAYTAWGTSLIINNATMVHYLVFFNNGVYLLWCGSTNDVNINNIRTNTTVSSSSGAAALDGMTVTRTANTQNIKITTTSNATITVYYY